MPMILIYELSEQLLTKKQTIAVAESCTGGGLANEITKLAGASKVFNGGIIAYANETKEHILSIPSTLLADGQAVSEAVALLMAENCKKLFASTWAISTTGFSGPQGGTAQNPVGTAWVGICGPELKLAKRFYFPNCSRSEHREKTIQHALLLLLEYSYKAGSKKPSHQ